VLDACDRDWKTISPAIFGSMFQSVRDAETRRQLGEHYTSEENILKTLNPLFLDELRAEFAHIRTLGKYEADNSLNKLRDKLGRIRYMDPACGCGNFIIVAYRELRDLELAILERLDDHSPTSTGELWPTSDLKVTLDHFYGIEIDEWPARIAETAMFLIDRQCDLKLTASSATPRPAAHPEAGHHRRRQRSAA
jgi:type I restriction-modification system DNA methylase subunit